MKTRPHFILLPLFVTLLVANITAVAEEKITLGSSATLTSTTLGGYVDSTVHWEIQPNPETSQHECRGWWRKVLRRLGFHWRH